MSGDRTTSDCDDHHRRDRSVRSDHHPSDDHHHHHCVSDELNYCRDDDRCDRRSERPIPVASAVAVATDAGADVVTTSYPAAGAVVAAIAVVNATASAAMREAVGTTEAASVVVTACPAAAVRLR